ncbi:MAG: hypothetical protein H7Y01_15615 [Ferruginibacter sp.]|nr:hypothetical protein [Chitinophagaceae bacterium]
MKSILYVGATLMIGASIYGFVDYKKTSQNKEFSSMYKEEQETAPVVSMESKTTEPVIKKDADVPVRQPKVRVAGIEKKTLSKKQVTPPEEIIAAIQPIGYDEKMVTNEIKEIEKSAVDVNISNDSGVEKKVVKKKKKLNHKIFSRAPLRDEVEIDRVQPAKVSVKKTENKEQ